MARPIDGDRLVMKLNNHRASAHPDVSAVLLGLRWEITHLPMLW